MDESTATACRSTTRWWQPEWPVFVLVGVVALIYLTRIESPPLRGEESRRGLVAITMQTSGDWIVPRQQGSPFYMSSRPPLQNWMIAAVGACRGVVDEVAIRLPSILALFGMVLVLYAYSRRFLSTVGAFATAVSYATMFQVLELGRTGETDLLFTLWLASSLLVWHWGDSHAWTVWVKWLAAYLLLAAATMTKGPQAPVYFAATVGTWLLLEGRWRHAVSLPHLAGIALYVGVLGLWVVPFTQAVGLAGLRHAFAGDVLLYGQDRSLATVAWHVATFPLQLLFGSWAPWSLLLINYASANFRKQLGHGTSPARFAAIALAISLPTVWFVTGARTRFLMSMVPMVAILTGVAIETLWQMARERRLALAALLEPARLRPVLSLFQTTTIASVACGLTGVGVLVTAIVARLTQHELQHSLPLPWAIAWCVIAGGVAAVLWSVRRMDEPRHCLAGLTATALFIGGTYTTIVVDDMNRRSARVDITVKELLSKLPSDIKLVSLGPVLHTFEYHYYRQTGRLIPMVEKPTTNAKLATPIDWFCTSDPAFADEATCPFAFERIATISFGRYRKKELEWPVTVGRDLRPMPAQSFLQQAAADEPLRQ